MKYCKVYYASVNDRDSNAIEFNNSVDGKSKSSMLAESLKCSLELENIYDAANIEIPNLLIIEDEFVNIYNCLNQLGGYLDILGIESVVVITKSKVLNEFLIKTSGLLSSPSCITLDFNLDDLEIGQVTFTEMASRNYDSLKERFPDTPIMALTNFSFDHFSKDLVEKVRTHHDSVMQKTLNFWMSYPLLVHDKIEIGKLSKKVDELTETLIEKEGRNDQLYIKNYFGGMPITVDTIANITINGKTPQEILSEFNLGGGTSIAWKCPFYTIAKNLHSSYYLVLGSSGSGKKEIANIIHKLSAQKGKYLRLNCGDLKNSDTAVTKTRLFGAEGGKITGVGRSEGDLDKVKDDGTLFLDEFQELPTEVQSIFLTILDDGIYYPMDGGKEKQLRNTKIVFATDQDIQKHINDKKLLPQFYFRISTEAVIKIPSLSEIDKAEFKLIVKKVLSNINQKQKTSYSLDKNCIDKLYAFDYSNGNIRKLRGIIHRAITLSPESTISPHWLLDDSLDNASISQFKDNDLQEKVQQLIKISAAITSLGSEKPTQVNIAALLNVSQPQVGFYFTQDSSPKKIAAIISQKLLNKTDIKNLLRLKIFNQKFSDLCKQHYLTDIN